MVERRQDSKRKHFGFAEGALQVESPSLTALRQALGVGFGNKFKHNIWESLKFALNFIKPRFIHYLNVQPFLLS